MGLNNLQKIISIFAQQTQYDEDMLQDFFVERYLATAEGAQLDGLGQIIGINRGLLNDTDYRARLYLQIAQNFSEGTIENLISIYLQLMAADSVILTEIFPAEFGILAINPTPIADATTVTNAIIAAKAAGVGISFLSQTNGEPFFAFLGMPGNTNGFGSIWDSTLGGIYISLIGVDPPPPSEYEYEENLSGWSVGQDMEGVGDGYWTKRLELSGTSTMKAVQPVSDKLFECKNSAGDWVAFSLNNTLQNDGLILIKPDSAPGGRWTILFHYDATGGFGLQHLAGSQLRLVRFSDWNPLVGWTEIANWDAQEPGSIPDEVKILVVGDRITVWMDNVFIGTALDSNHPSGGLGVMGLGAGGWLGKYLAYLKR